MVDELSIRRVLAAYCQLVDDGRFDELVALFTVHGGFSLGHLAITGRDEMRAWFEANQPPELRGKHLTTNALIDVDGDDAVARSDFVFLSFADRQLRPVLTGRYRDELRRVDGQWLLHRRDTVLLRVPR